MPTSIDPITTKFAHLWTELVRDLAGGSPAVAAKLILARGLWGIGAVRFLMLRMYEQPMSRWSESMSYLKDIEPGLHTINWQGEGRQLTVDKLLTTERFIRAGIPTPRLIAVIGRKSEQHPHGGLFSALHAIEEVQAMLASSPDDLFVKPATGWRGEGAMGPERRDGRWMVGESKLSDREFAQHLLANAPPSGWLVQERLRSHPALAPIGGEFGLGCLRMNTALTTTGPELLFAFAKIMGKPGLVDNFGSGKYGNLVAGVDKESGTLPRVFGFKPGRRYLIEPVDQHPITGAPLIGFQLPLWNEVVALTKRTAVAFPETPLVGADIAITADGPVVIEIQSDWGSNVAQLTSGAGLRPLLREVVPRLAMSDEVKRKAMRDMGLIGTARRWRKPRRQPRDTMDTYPLGATRR